MTSMIDYNEDNSYFNQVNNTYKLPRTRNYQERSVPKFLKKVFSILEGNNFCEYISWSNDGKALIIKKPTDFANIVLPQFFKHSNFSSFIRQLNMYKFKKSKSCSYDHIYSHQMFQRERIDLLRNIQRKATEGINSAPADVPAPKLEEDVDVERILHENTLYKRLHKELTSQVVVIESKMTTIKSEVARLYEEQQKSKANENFLKGVLKSLTKVYGFENIAKIIENDAIETGSPFSSAQKAAALQADCFESYSTANNAGLSQSELLDDGMFENSNEGASEYQYSEHFSTNDTPHFYESNQIACGQESEKHPLYMLDFGLGKSNSINNCDDMLAISPKLSKHNSYVIWVDELKNKENNSEMFFSQINKGFNGDLTIEDF